MIAVLVTTYSRPEAFGRSIRQIMLAAKKVSAPILVVDDGSSESCLKQIDAHIRISRENFAPPFMLLHLPKNRGLACALNVGLSFLLADSSVEAVSYFQDDVDVVPETIEAMDHLSSNFAYPLCTGHDAPEHLVMTEEELDGIWVREKKTCRATHLHGTRQFWQGVLPIPTRALGAPYGLSGGQKLGSNADWWIVDKSPRSTRRLRVPIACVPLLVASFCFRAEDSTWTNEAKDEPEKSDVSIRRWLKLRMGGTDYDSLAVKAEGLSN